MATWYQSLVENPGLVEFKGLNLSNLQRDQAYMKANTSINVVGLYSSDDECFECPYKLMKVLHGGKEDHWIANTSVQYTWRFLNTAHEEYRAHNNRSGLICEMRPTIGEFGVYRVNVGSCVVQPELKPVDIYIPLIMTCSLLMVLGAVYSIYTMIRSRYYTAKKSKSQREKVLAERKTLALDIFQGIIILLWLFFTTGAGGYHFLDRVWHGIALKDVLLDAVVWAAGFDLPNRLSRDLKKKHNRFHSLWRLMKLSLIFGMLDACLQWISNQNFDLEVLCRPLERIGIAYLIAGTVYVVTVRKSEENRKGSVERIFVYIKSVVGCLSIGMLFAAYIALTVTLTTNNDKMNFDPNQQTKSSERTYEAFNLIKIISGHERPIKNINEYFSFNSGALGIISTTIYGLFGLHAGTALVLHEEHYSRMKRWTLYALNQVVLGTALTILNWYINFNLWPVCVIILSATAFQLIFYLVYMITDVWYFWNDAPFYSVGRNTLLVILGQTLCGESLPFSLQIPLKTHLIFLMQNLWTIMLWILICIYAVKRNVTISV